MFTYTESLLDKQNSTSKLKYISYQLNGPEDDIFI